MQTMATPKFKADLAQWLQTAYQNSSGTPFSAMPPEEQQELIADLAASQCSAISFYLSQGNSPDHPLAIHLKKTYQANGYSPMLIAPDHIEAVFIHPFTKKHFRMSLTDNITLVLDEPQNT